MGKQGIVLDHQSHAAFLGRNLQPVSAVGYCCVPDRDAAVLQGLEASHERQQGSLTRSRWAKQAHELATFYMDADVVDGEGLIEAMGYFGDT